MTIPKLFAIFPYLKAFEACEVRGITLYPSEELEKNGLLSEETKNHLRILCSLFYLQNDEQIDRMLYAVPEPEFTNSQLEKWVKSLKEAQLLIAYLNSSLHPATLEPFLPCEHSDLFLFEPKPISKFLIGHKDVLEDKSLVTMDDMTVDGYEGRRNWSVLLWTSEGCRIYPPMPTFGLNYSQDLRRDLHFVEANEGDIWAFWYLLAGGKVREKDTEDRIFRSLEWYNRSTSDQLSEDLALIYLAIAFECLLALKQGQDTTARIKEVILSLLGKVPRLDEWVEQFYEARSKIVHEGHWSWLEFYPKSDKKSGKAKNNNLGDPYRSLTAYGRRVFQLCWTTIATGILKTEQAKLSALFIDNQERLETIARVLNELGPTPEDKIRLVAEDITRLHIDWLVSNHFVQLNTVFGTGRMLIQTYLDTNPSHPKSITDLLSQISSSSKEMSDLDQIELYGQIITLSKEVLNPYKDRLETPLVLFDVIRVYAQYASSPDFRIRAIGGKSLRFTL